jgi:RHS repeat-associated protein
MGGPVTQTFTYDDLYRLTGATGVFQTAPGRTDRYNLGLTYDTIHNPLTKRQTHEVVQPSGSVVAQQKTTYAFTYRYAGAQPHAVTGVDDRTYRYDANGNQLNWTHDQNGTRREITWDEENRIQAIADNGRTLRYTYDHAGQRVVKRGPGGETVYVNPFFSIRNGTDGTKHVYAGDRRIVSKPMKQDRPESNPRGQPPQEKDLFFYHPDHLGSAAFVTDENGSLSQHEEYFPFGESWVEEGNAGERTPYQYNDQELDDETGLYYYGARYYDPRISHWLSVDPALSAYLGRGETAEDEDDDDPARRLPRAGFLEYNRTAPDEAADLSIPGVYDSSNLALYAYAGQNPTTFIDEGGLGKKTKGKKPTVSKSKVVGGTTHVTVQIPISKKTNFYKTARHMRRAVKRGHPTTLTINRPGAAANRALSLKGVKTKSGKDRDEYPPAMFTQGGTGAHIRHIKSGDNRSMGAHLGNVLSSYSDGTQVKFKFDK